MPTIPVPVRPLQASLPAWFDTLQEEALAPYTPQADLPRILGLSYTLTREDRQLWDRESHVGLWAQENDTLHYHYDHPSALDHLLEAHPAQMPTWAHASLLAQQIQHRTHPLRSAVLEAIRDIAGPLSAGGTFVQAIMLRHCILLAGPSFGETSPP